MPACSASIHYSDAGSCRRHFPVYNLQETIATTSIYKKHCYKMFEHCLNFSWCSQLKFLQSVLLYSVHLAHIQILWHVQHVCLFMSKRFFSFRNFAKYLYPHIPGGWVHSRFSNILWLKFSEGNVAISWRSHNGNERTFSHIIGQQIHGIWILAIYIKYEKLGV